MNLSVCEGTVSVGCDTCFHELSGLDPIDTLPLSFLPCSGQCGDVIPAGIY